MCDAPLAPQEEIPTAVAVPSSEPEWRREVAHRLQVYRARRRRLGLDDSHPLLPFQNHGSARGELELPRPAAQRARPRSHRTERVEIAVVQPELDFTGEEEPGLHPVAAVVPVACARERLYAGLVDAALLLLAYSGFLALFGSLGGQFTFGKLDTVVYAVAFFLHYLQYFALFTIFGGSTPGMHLRRLCVVSFDGGAPGPRQLLWRSFGYLLSGGAMLLGFAWSLWDDDHLTWQDRISQTYITSAAGAAESVAVAVDALAPK